MFYLRELERKDLSAINKWRNDPELISLLGASFRYINLDVDVKWYESYMGNRGNAVRCAIIEDDKDEILGLVSLVSINYMNQSAELHIMIGDTQNRGRGIGTFAINTMLHHAFNNMNLQRVELTVLEDNIRAKCLYEKCGFVYEGRKRKAKYKNGNFVNVLMYAMLKSEFSDNMGGGVIPDLPIEMMLETKEAAEIDAIIRCCDDAFDRPIGQRLIYPELLEKIHQKGRFIYAYNEKVLGYCAFYANDSERKKAYISLIAVTPECQKMHIGTKLLNESFAIMRTYSMKQCLLEVQKNNQKAIHFYKSKKFSVWEEREKSYIMKYEL